MKVKDVFGDKAECCLTDGNGYDAMCFYDGGGRLIKSLDESHAECAEICIQSHDALVEALQKARTGYLNLIELELLPHQGYYDECQECINEMDKVLANSRGES